MWCQRCFKAPSEGAQNTLSFWTICEILQVRKASLVYWTSKTMSKKTYKNCSIVTLNSLNYQFPGSKNCDQGLNLSSEVPSLCIFDYRWNLLKILWKFLFDVFWSNHFEMKRWIPPRFLHRQLVMSCPESSAVPTRLPSLQWLRLQDVDVLSLSLQPQQLPNHWGVQSLDPEGRVLHVVLGKFYEFKILQRSALEIWSNMWYCSRTLIL